MEIIDNRNNQTTTFKNVENAQVFIYSNETDIFMKIPHYDDDSTEEGFNAISLIDGELTHFWGTDEVIIPKARLIIE